MPSDSFHGSGAACAVSATTPARGVDKILSKPSSRVKVAVIATDEELVIATDTYNLVK